MPRFLNSILDTNWSRSAYCMRKLISRLKEINPKGFLYTLTLTLYIMSASSTYATQVETIIGDDAYEPFSFMNNGKPDGIYTRIIEEVFDKMPDFSVKFVLLPWKRGLKKIKVGNELAIYPPYFRPKERPYIKPYSESLLVEKVIVICNTERIKGRSFLKFPEDFYGLFFANDSGVLTAGDAFLKAVKAGKITMEESTVNSNIRKLATGRVDCYTQSSLVFDRKVKLLDISTEKMMKVISISEENGYLGFSEKFEAPWKEKFIKEFNKTIKAMKESGKISKIIASYAL